MICDGAQLCFAMGILFSLVYIGLLAVSLAVHRAWAVETLEPD